MTVQIPLDVALLVSALMACTYWCGRISERERAARRDRNRIAYRYRNDQPTNQIGE
jgi:hypothetical protein